MSESLVFKALSDGTRREILRLLRDRDRTAGEIADHFDISKPSISHHLNLLKHAHLVLDVRRGQNIVYSLNMTVFQEALGWMFSLVKDQGTSPEGEPTADVRQKDQEES